MHLVLLARLDLHRVFIRYSLVTASAAAGIPFCDQHCGLWLSALFLVANANIVVNKRVCAQHSPQYLAGSVPAFVRT
jgi:hypothetical protein